MADATDEIIWEIWRPYSRNGTGEPFVSFDGHGQIRMSATAYGLLGRPEQVDLLYDSKQRRVGIRPGEYPDSIKVLHAHNGASAQLSAGRFLGFYGLRGYTRKRGLAYMDNGVLCVDLNESTDGHDT